MPGNANGKQRREESATSTIRVSDGKTTTSLAAFNITVLAVAGGSATLELDTSDHQHQWIGIDESRGLPRVLGPRRGRYTNSVTLNNAGLSSYVVGSLATGTYYFAVAAVNSVGAESAKSNAGSKTVQ